MLNAINRSGLIGIKWSILAIGICIVYAISDEFHQSFVPGRSPQIKDVFVDGAGGIVGIGLYRLARRVKARRIRGKA